MDKINGRNIIMESYDKIKKTLAIAFMNVLDANRPEGKMCLSNGECSDIEKAFNEQDWPRLAGYLDKYTESEDEKTRKAIVELLKEVEEDETYTGRQHIPDMLSYLEKQKEKKPNIELIQRSWYMEGYHDREFGMEPKWIIKTGEGGPKHEPNPKYGQPLAENLKEQKPILEVFGFKVGDAVRLKDGDGRKHIIKSFEEVEGIHGPNFYHVEFEDNSARDGIYPGEEYPNDYYTQMEKFEEEQKPVEKQDYSGLNDLEEAAEKWVFENCFDCDIVGEHRANDAFIAGAKWQAEQVQETIELAEDHAYLAGAVNEREKMMKEAVEYEVWDFSLEAYPHVNIPLDNKQYRNGDKVRVIVLHKED